MSEGDWDPEEATRIDQSEARLSLIATNGPLEGQVFGSAGRPVTLGRGRGCAVVLRAPESSRMHSRIEYRGGQFWLSDLGTLNGTRLNGQLVTEPAPIQDGDRLVICGQELLVTIGEISGWSETVDCFEEAPAESAGPTPAFVPSVEPPLATAAAFLPLVDESAEDVTNLVPPKPPTEPAKQATEPPASASAVISPYRIGEGSAGAAEPSITTRSEPRRSRTPLVLGAALALCALGAAGVAGLAWMRRRPVVLAPPPARSVQPAPLDMSAAPLDMAPAPPETPTSPATISALELVTVHATIEGVVTHVATRGAAVKKGDALVEVERPSPRAAEKLAHLNRLTAKYGSSPEYEDFIAQARHDYERASRAKVTGSVRAPSGGVVVGSDLHPGEHLHRGDGVAQIAASVRLTADSAALEGAGAACRVTLLDRGDLVLQARVDPAAAPAGRRHLILSQLPPELPLGAVGRIRALCPVD